jgi:DNA-binding CsgD family transcriptional regulator
MLRDVLIQKGLSNREAEVAELVSKGLSNKEVANQLFVTEKTVKFHLTNIYKKMNVKSRAQLIVWCLPHLGFVETETKAEPTLQASLIGLLTAQANGLQIPISLEERDKLMHCARSLGISFKMKLEKQWHVATRLDLDSQTLLEIESQRLGRQESVHQRQLT